MEIKAVMAHRSVGHPVDAAHETLRESSPSPGWPAVAGHDKEGLRWSADEIITAARGWLGTPYVHQASVRGVGADCVGLLRGVWRELIGAEPEAMPPYSADWAEAGGEETLYRALARHLREIPLADVAPGDVALFRMLRHGPAKHCGIVGETPALKQRSGSASKSLALKQRSGSASKSLTLKQRSGSASKSLTLKQRSGSASKSLTLIHARQNHCVCEEPFAPFWLRKLASAFRVQRASTDSG